MLSIITIISKLFIVIAKEKGNYRVLIMYLIFISKPFNHPSLWQLQ